MTVPATRPPATRGRVRELFTTRRLVLSVVVAVAIAMLWVGFTESRDVETTVRVRPAAVLQVFPAEGANALRQEPVGVQLAPEFTGELEIDQRPIPLDQLERPVDPVPGGAAPANRGLTGLNRISFTPGEGKDIERLEPGQHTVRLLYWERGVQTREQAQAYSWTFRAT